MAAFNGPKSTRENPTYMEAVPGKEQEKPHETPNPTYMGAVPGNDSKSTSTLDSPSSFCYKHVKLVEIGVKVPFPDWHEAVDCVQAYSCGEFQGDRHTEPLAHRSARFGP